MELGHGVGGVISEDLRYAICCQNAAPYQEIAERILRRSGADQHQLSLRPIQHFPQRRSDDRQIPGPSLLQDIAHDHSEWRDLDALQAHGVTALFNTLSPYLFRGMARNGLSNRQR